MRPVALSAPRVSDAQVAYLSLYPSSHEFDCPAGIHPAFDSQFADVAYQQEIRGLVSALVTNVLDSSNRRQTAFANSGDTAFGSSSSHGMRARHTEHQRIASFQVDSICRTQ